MSVNKFVSIDSILYKLSLVIDDRHFSESRFREWAIEGFRQSKVKSKYCLNYCILEIKQHKAILPEDLVFVDQIIHKPATSSSNSSNDTFGSGTYLNLSNLIENSVDKSQSNLNGWSIMRKSASSFVQTVTTEGGPINSETFNVCDHQYSIDSNSCLTSTAKDGNIIISYYGYTKDVNGKTLIPDNENLKQALMHFCLYMFWLSKSLMKEEGSRSERDWHYNKFILTAGKAADEINQPSNDEYENLKNITNRIISDPNQYRNLFIGLGTAENIKHV